MVTLNTIIVAGAGTMGQGIAQLCATLGKQTIMYDVSQEGLTKARQAIDQNLYQSVAKGRLAAEKVATIQTRIVYTTRLEDAVGDMLIEAIVEQTAPKKALFRVLEQQNSPQFIIASNTSSIPMEVLSEGLSRPERVVGLHFFNPATVMKLVEVISGPQTLACVAQQAEDLALLMNKTVVRAKDAPGFIVNRVARPYYAESLRLLGAGGLVHEDIDRLLESVGFRMGPFRLMDLIGVDTNLSVTTSIYEGLGCPKRFEPNPIQQSMVLQGHHGRKSGQGFYPYSKDEGPIAR
ncbi:MAG: 3-hydroxybutyryl-CoA dehydrogenase [Sphingomonadales bacterium]|nr:3-hydroxybutyryl-CoA dehydrogenase [Sphingomonadales bacterium]